MKKSIALQPILPVYIHPQKDTELASQVIYGDEITVLKKRGSWVFGKVSEGEEGWIEKEALQERQEEAPANRLPIQSLFAHIYRSPDTISSPPLMTLPFGARVIVSDPKGQDRWIPIRLEQGKGAWIQRGDLDWAPKVKTLEEAIAQGLRFMGLPYTWGGTSSFGFDCSGFVRLLFRLMGRSLPRNSYQQANVEWLLPIDRENIQRGDLLFFGEEKISHVGLYLGNEEFLHSGVRDGFHGVGISPLQTTNYLFKEARRA